MNTFFSIDENRVKWIDIAKGISIVFVIIGHTIPHGEFRNFIFSFHMPLFFILSGFTFRAPSNIKSIPKRITKNSKSLLWPSILASIITVLGYWTQGGGYSFDKFLGLAIKMVDAWWWASGVNVNNHSGLGALWFLITLFWIRAIVDIITVLVKPKYQWIVFVLLTIIGIGLGKHKLWLPQNMDVTFVALIFFYVGILWKKFEALISKYSIWILLISFLLWAFCLYKGIFIELAIRHYPRNIISILEAIGAAYIVCTTCKYIERIKYVGTIFTFIGMHTLIIFIVHHLDRFSSFYWKSSSVIMTNISRVFIVLGISLVVYLGQEFYNRLRKKCI